MVLTFLLPACGFTAPAPNDDPVVSITSPEQGADFHEYEPLTVLASLADDQGASDLALSWSIEPDPGTIGNEFRSEDEASLYLGDGLPQGSWRVAILVVDEFQAAAESTLTLQMDENAPPVVRFDEPQPDAEYGAGDSVGVSVTVKQRDDDMSNITLTWGGSAAGAAEAPDRPNADGAAIFYIDGLARGRHEITVTASDGVNDDTDAVAFRIAAG
ncbi:MAG: hypothetical protein EXR71_00815 [Myxococcales bacterium]|nr:hypothetical protein [Myxococcales bacterium]